MSNSVVSALALLIVAVSPLVPAPAVAAQEPRLTVAIRADRPEVHAGDEIPITFSVTNVGTGPYAYVSRHYDRSGRLGEFRLQAVDERGTPVADPRTTSPVPRGYVGGGLGTPSNLRPGESFTITIALNLWAVITAPGVYTVRGDYVDEGGQARQAPPVRIRVRPRTDAEMGRYVAGLAAEEGRTDGRDRRSRLIQRLMYTGDRRAAHVLLTIDDSDNNASFWIGEAFASYLPRDEGILRDAIATIGRRGLSPSSVTILEQLQAPRQAITALVGAALIDPRDAVRAEAALAAQRYPDDRFMAPLIALALDDAGVGRVRAIHALAQNRTDAGVEALRRLRRDPDAAIRAATARAITSAYRSAGTAPGGGRRLRADDFPDLVPGSGCSVLRLLATARFLESARVTPRLVLARRAQYGAKFLDRKREGPTERAPRVAAADPRAVREVVGQRLVVVRPAC